MVKSALERAGISLGQERREKTPATAPRKSADVLVLWPAPVLAVVPPKEQTSGSPLGGLSFSRTTTAEPMVVGDASFVDTPAAPEPVRIDAAEQTMAFGDLLGPTTTEETGFVSAYETEKTETSGWSGVDEPKEVAEEDEQEEEARESVPSWRREEGTTEARED